MVRRWQARQRPLLSSRCGDHVGRHRVHAPILMPNASLHFLLAQREHAPLATCTWACLAHVRAHAHASLQHAAPHGSIPHAPCTLTCPCTLAQDTGSKAALELAALRASIDNATAECQKLARHAEYKRKIMQMEKAAGSAEKAERMFEEYAAS